jgi:hypothetical protein
MKQQRSVAIRIRNGGSAHIIGNTIAGFDDAIDADVEHAVVKDNDIRASSSALLLGRLRREFRIPAEISDAEIVILLRQLRSCPTESKTELAQSSKIGKWLTEYAPGLNSAIDLLDKFSKLF